MVDLKNNLPAGVILAGGKSTRFGTDKAFFIAKGASLTWVELAVQKLLPCTTQIYLSINESQQEKMAKLFIHLPNVTFVVDDTTLKNYGPLGGLYQISKIMTESNYMLIPVDTPEITAAELNILLEHPNHYVKTPQHDHYLIAHLPQKKEILKALIKKREHHACRLIESLHTKPLCFDLEEPFQNINTKPY